MNNSFSVRERAVLDALCRRIIPAAFEHSGNTVDLPASVGERLVAGDPVLKGKISLLLRFFDSRVCALFLNFASTRFSRMEADRQDLVLQRWERSRIGVQRTIFQVFRRLILSTYYAMPESYPAIGFRGPLYLRETAVAWEGALAGNSSDSEPVARTLAGDERTYHQRIALETAANSKLPAGLTQGFEVDRDLQVTADVCVVGTGAGGAVAAARLAEAGYDVVILEEGGYWREADFTEQEFEMVPRLYAERGARATDDLGISLLQGRSVGGSTLINWMIMLRTPDHVWDEWMRDYGTEGMSGGEMAAAYEMIEHDVHARMVPEDAHAPNNRVVLDGSRGAGWKAVSAKINAKGCVRAGFCGLGCRYGAKQSTLLTYIPRALAAGARLYSDARVERVQILERGGRTPLKEVSGTIVDRETWKARVRVKVRAPIVVLAGGAVGTPLILERSGMGGGMVGKNLRLHPTTAVIGRYDREMYGTAGIPQSALSDHDIRSNNDYGFWIEAPSLLPGLAGAAIPGFGSAHREVMQSFPNLSSLIVLNRDGSNIGASNGEVRLKRNGGTTIRYSLSKPDSQMLQKGIAAAARIHFEAGALEVQTLHAPSRAIRLMDDIAAVSRGPLGPNQIGLFSAHVNGTCRMGSSSKVSACNPDGERFGSPGVYVADGSLFPTAPGVNPQATIMALATVVAQRIITRHPLPG